MNVTFNGSKANNLDRDCCQRRSVLEYWLQRNQSPVYPLKLLQLTNDKANLIADNPLTYKTTEFRDTRMAAMGHFSIFYKITDGAIIITAFWDNRQNPKKLRELLKAREGRG